MLVGCASAASGPPPPADPEAPRDSFRKRDLLDVAYPVLRLKERPCAPESPDVCCQQRNQALDKAMVAEDGERIVQAIDDVTFLCPELRDRAAVALSYFAPAIKDSQAGTVDVMFAADVPESDRLYWASAFIDRRYPAGTKVAPGKHRVSVELHVVTDPGDGSAQLTRVHLDRELEVPARTRVKLTVTLRRQMGVEARDAFWLEASKPELALVRAKSGDITLEGGKGYRKRLRRPLFPDDLGATLPWLFSVRVCVSKQGRVQSVSLQDTTIHPRVFGPVLDSFLRAEYVPPRVQGQPVAFCHPVRYEVAKLGF